MQETTQNIASNTQMYKQWGIALLRSIIGITMTGLTIGSLYLIHFLHSISKLSKTSREYYEKREHIQTQTLLRYSIMIMSIFIIDILVVTYFDWGAKYFGVGLVAALMYFLMQEIKQRRKEPQKHLKQD